MQLYGARWILPIGSPPVRNGAVAVDGGRVVAAGDREQVVAAAGDTCALRDLGETIVLPGLVNAHTHLELSWMADDPPPGGSYVDWIRGLLERRPLAEPEHARQAARQAVEALVARGTVAVGDVANETWIVPLLADTELHGIVFHEVYATRPEEAASLIREATARIEALTRGPDRVVDTDRWQVVPAAHAPHTASSALIRGIGEICEKRRLPFSIHLAESEAEVLYLKEGRGPLLELFEERGMPTDAFVPHGLSPVEHLDRLGALSERTLAVHCVRLDQRDHSRLQTRGATVVTCPRSNRRLGVGVAAVPRLLAEGIPVALGTDSLASAPDLDLLAEMAALCREHPSLAPAAVVRMATLNGAKALGLSDRFGTIAPGKSSRLLTVRMSPAEEDPFRTLCSEPADVGWLDAEPAGTGPE